MASPASIAGHPVHPMIIPFPIALWIFSLVADLIYLWRGNSVWRDYIAFYTLLAGIIGAVAAAVPGSSFGRSAWDGGRSIAPNLPVY